MKMDYPLTTDFLQLYPYEAARVLEEVGAEDVAALFNSMPTELIAPVVAVMLPEPAAQGLMLTTPVVATKILAQIQASNAARIFRFLTPQSQEVISKEMSSKILRRMRHYFDFERVSAGDLMESDVSMLPLNISVAEAIRRVERYDQPPACEIYVVDDEHRLVGQIGIGRLITVSRHAQLGDVINRHTQALSVHAMAESLLLHPAWRRWRRLPVIERDNTLVGVLDYVHVQEFSVRSDRTYRDTGGGLVSLVGLYWLSVIQLLDSLFSLAGARKGERR